MIPERRLRLPTLQLEQLGVPVGLAFFTIGSDGAVTAHHPSPLGTTTWEVDADSWRAVEHACPLVGLLTAAEALLVNTTRGATEHWIVPIDDCHRLVAVIRREWRGLSVGRRVSPAVEQFFTALNETPHIPG